ncbi:MAG: hypothetical protein ACRBBK_07355 [Paracoccaceae bacterium]
MTMSNTKNFDVQLFPVAHGKHHFAGSSLEATMMGEKGMGEKGMGEKGMGEKGMGEKGAGEK